jgi:hypothetical protein
MPAMVRPFAASGVGFITLWAICWNGPKHSGSVIHLDQSAGGDRLQKKFLVPDHSRYAATASTAMRSIIAVLR